MKNKTVLVVEDEQPIATMYKYKLEIEDYVVILAKNGQEGLEQANKHRPNLILLDLRMPVMSGDEMLERLRSYEWASDIKVIVLTNISRDEAPANLRLLDVDRYIVKAHHTPSQVLDIVEEVLNVKQKK